MEIPILSIKVSADTLGVGQVTTKDYAVVEAY